MDGSGALAPPHNQAAKLRALYSGWFLISLTDRMWQFSVPFFLITMDSLDSMRFATIYALVVGAANVISGPVIGYMVDRSGRRRTVTAALVIQALLVTASWLITRSALTLGRAHHPRMVVLMAALITSCTVSSLANLASTLAIQRDWIDVLAVGGNLLERARSRLRAIQTACRIAAPIAMSGSLCVLHPASAAWVVAAANVCCVAGFILMLRTIYVMTPQLGVAKGRAPPGGVLSPTQTLVRYSGSFSRWVRYYRAQWREYLDINGDGRVDRSELTFAVRTGFNRCWDLWVGCFAGGFLLFWIRRIVMMPYI